MHECCPALIEARVARRQAKVDELRRRQVLAVRARGLLLHRREHGTLLARGRYGGRGDVVARGTRRVIRVGGDELPILPVLMRRNGLYGRVALRDTRRGWLL